MKRSASSGTDCGVGFNTGLGTGYESAALTAELTAQTVLFNCLTAILPNAIFAAYAQFYARSFPPSGLIGNFQLLEGELDRLGRRMHVTLRYRDAAVPGSPHDREGIHAEQARPSQQGMT